jgi:hypothetical protein
MSSALPICGARINFTTEMIQQYLPNHREWNSTWPLILNSPLPIEPPSHPTRDNVQLPVFHSFHATQPPPHGDVKIQLASHHSSIVYPPLHIELPHSNDLWKIKEALDKFASSCVACWVMKADPTHNYRFQECAFFANNEQQWLDWYQSISFPQGWCYGCGCPQHVSEAKRGSINI